MPNVTPPGWFECDIWEVTKAGFVREYEIKVSMADWKADALKSLDSADWPNPPAKRTKHELLLDGRGPNEFTFLVPEELVVPLTNRGGLSFIPEYAGVTVAYKTKATRIPYQLGLREIRPARRIHKVKATEANIRKVLDAAYWRMHDLMLRLEKHRRANR